MTKKIRTIQGALKYLDSENIGYHKGYIAFPKENMYPIRFDDGKDLIRWCNEDKLNQEIVKTI